MIRQYVGVYAPSRSVCVVQITGPKESTLADHALVDEAVEERTGYVPEIVRSVPVTNNPNVVVAL